MLHLGRFRLLAVDDNAAAAESFRIGGAYGVIRGQETKPKLACPLRFRPHAKLRRQRHFDEVVGSRSCRIDLGRDRVAWLRTIGQIFDPSTTNASLRPLRFCWYRMF